MFSFTVLCSIYFFIYTSFPFLFTNQLKHSFRKVNRTKFRDLRSYCESQTGSKPNKYSDSNFRMISYTKVDQRWTLDFLHWPLRGVSPQYHHLFHLLQILVLLTNECFSMKQVIESTLNKTLSDSLLSDCTMAPPSNPLKLQKPTAQIEYIPQSSLQFYVGSLFTQWLRSE